MKRISHKAKEAWRKNLSKWEDKQEIMHKLSDNKEMIGMGFVIGSLTVFLASILAIFIANI